MTPYIQTYTGKRFYPLDPNPDDIDIVDIAHALSNICRWNGHCGKFYSVAEHSFHVSRYSGIYTLEGLLHDAAEAYLCDLPKPLKAVMKDYQEAERCLDYHVRLKFGLDSYVQPCEVLNADLALLHFEHSQLFTNPVALSTVTPVQPEIMIDTLPCWQPKLAESIFLDRFNVLTNQRRP